MVDHIHDVDGNVRYLGSNQLTGNIPSSLGNLYNLQRLYVFQHIHDIDVVMIESCTPIN